MSIALMHNPKKKYKKCNISHLKQANKFNISSSEVPLAYETKRDYI